MRCWLGVYGSGRMPGWRSLGRGGKGGGEGGGIMRICQGLA